MKSLVQIFDEQRARDEHPTVETVHAEYTKELWKEIEKVFAIAFYAKIQGRST